MDDLLKTLNLLSISEGIKKDTYILEHIFGIPHICGDGNISDGEMTATYCIYSGVLPNTLLDFLQSSHKRIVEKTPL